MTEHLSLALRLALALVCVTAAVGKLHSRAAFHAFVTSVEQIARPVPLIRAPARFAAAVAVPTVVAELAVAALLPWPATAAAGTVLAVVVFGALTAAVWFAVATGVPARCACFGRMSRLLGPVHVVRNLTLTVLAAVAWWLAGMAAGPLTPAGVAVSTVAGAVLAVMIVRWEDLAALVSGVEVPS